MRKYLGFIFILLFCCFFGFSGERPDIFVQADYSYSGEKGVEHDLNSFEPAAVFFTDSYECLAAFRVNENSFDFTADGIFWPDFSTFSVKENSIKIGAGGVYHFLKYEDAFYENDVIFDLAFGFFTKNNFSFIFRNGYELKFSNIYALSETIWNQSLSLWALFDKKFQNGFETYFSWGTHDRFRYILFISPQYTLGVAYNFNFGLRLAGEGEIRFTDQFTSSPNVEMILLRLSARYTF